MIWLGVDPGRSGAIAALATNGVLELIEFGDLTLKETWDAFEKYRGRGTTAMIEAVGAFPGQGVHSMFVFGDHFGSLKMALTAAGIPFDKVAPVTWKIAMGLARKTGKTDRKERKRLSREMAQRLYPDLEGINDATAEALLLAHYCKKLRRNL